MRKFICTMMIAMMVITPVIPVQRAQASGFPVVDIAHIAQSIVGYVQELADYVEAIQQTALSTSQLTQMITDYTQVLQEYEHYLDQIRQLQDVISGDDWNELIATVERELAEVSDISLTQILDPDDGDYEADLREILENQGLASPIPADVTDFYEDDLNVPAGELDAMNQRLERMDLEYRRYAAQHENVARNTTRMVELDDQITSVQAAAASLGEQSDLATLQMIAQIQLLQMKQQSLAMQQRNQELQLYEPTSLLINQQRARSVERERLRVQGAIGQANDGVGYDNFADEYGL
ncbi:MAG: hypothetical protein AAF465_13575 [Pseudomonadota bacterium]